MIIVTGDTHGDVSRLGTSNIKDSDNVSHVIIAGDFGLVWSGLESKQEKYWYNWLNTKPFETLVVLGNHENYERIYHLPVVERYGAPVYELTKKVFILQHGYKYTIEGQSFYIFGGADSIDKENRAEFVSWWRAEIPTSTDFHRGMQTCEDNDWTFDYVISHTAPHEAINKMDELSPEMTWGGKDYYEIKGGDPTVKMLDAMAGQMNCKKWFFGHFHQNNEFTVRNIDYVVLYEKLYKLGDKL